MKVIFKRIYLYIKRLFFTLKIFLDQSIFITIEFVNQILIFVSIVWWLEIATINGRLLTTNQMYSENIYQLEVLGMLTHNYIVICTFIFFLLIIRIFSFLTFSRKLRKFFDTLDDAKYSLLFFHFFVLFYILAYAFAGYLLFGYKISSFSFIGKSFIGCLQILSGSLTESQLQEVHSTVGSIYYFSYLVR